MKKRNQATPAVILSFICAGTSLAQTPYPDGRPAATLRMEAKDQGVVLKHGDGPGQCDTLGAREALIFEEKGVYHLFYDGAGPKGWLACLATSKDLKTWEKKGPILDFGKPGASDSAAACSPWVYFDGKEWHMFYLGTPNVSGAPDLIPSFPYLTLKARSKSLAGPWMKQPDVIPFSCKPNTYYADTASPGHIVKQGDEYLMFFSAAMKRTLSIARTKDLNGPWTIDPQSIVSPEEQIENSSLYFEPSNKTWFLFTNHIGLDEANGEYTDAVWVYWSKDLNKWDARNKAVVLDGKNCTWSKKCIGMPSVIKVGSRLAVFYDAPGGDSASHMGRDIGLAWLELPLSPPEQFAGPPPISLVERFRQPPNAYRMILYTDPGSDDACRKVVDYGFGGVQIHVRKDQNPWFKSAAVWQGVGAMIDRLRSHGLRVWLFDDVGYPSGAAGGEVVAENPAFESRSLMSVVQTGEGPTTVRIELPKDIPNVERFVYAVLYPVNAAGQADFEKGRVVPVQADRVETTGLDGKWLLSAFAKKISARFVVNKYWNASGRWPNLLEPAATDRWLALVHDQYAQHVPDFGKKVEAFYSNEPCFSFLTCEQDAKQEAFVQVPWADDLPDVFQRQHGYDLIPRLHALLGGDDDAAKLVRLHFFQTRAELVSTRYFKKLADRCRKYKVKSSGHILLEEYLFIHVLAHGDYLKAMANEDIPACDIPIPDATRKFDHYWMPKYVSSAAYLRNGRETAALLDPIIGRGAEKNWLLKPPADLFRRTINLAYLCGINQILCYGKWLEFTPEECRPYNEYVGRLSVMLRGAANAAQVAVYYPIETVQANVPISTRYWPHIVWPKANPPYLTVDRTVDQVAQGLLEHGQDFNFLNADAILAADMTGGYLAAGEHKYSAIIMPGVEVIPLAVLRKLDAFSRQGGTVLWTGRLPRLGVTPTEHATVQALAARYTVVSEPWTRVTTAVDPGFRLQLKADAPGLLSVRYLREEGHLYYLVNTLPANELRVTVAGPAGSTVRICNPNDGSTTDVSVPTDVTIGPFNSVFLLD